MLLACDYTNFRGGHWAPILAILCGADGANFNFLAIDSVEQQAYSSGCTFQLYNRPHCQ